MASMDRYLPRLSDPGRRWARFFALLAALALLTWIAIILRQVLTPLVAALAIAYILNPLVTWLEKTHQVKRALSISIGLGLLLLAGSSLLAAGTVQVVQLAGNIPSHARATFEWLDRTIPGLTGGADELEATDTQPTPPTDDRELALGGRDRLVQLASEHGLSLGSSVIGYIAQIVSNAFYWLSLTVLLPLYTFFFLLRFNEIVETIHNHLPGEYRPTIVRIAVTIDGALSSFFRGRLLICLAVGTLTGIGWLIVGVPYSLALGALVGMLNLVPFLSVLSLPPALILMYMQATETGANWVLMTGLVAGVYMAAQAVESFVLTPVIMSKASGLHPVTTVIALLVGGQLAGLLGLLLAIPIASTLKSFVAEYALPEIDRLAAAEPGESPDARAAPQATATEPQARAPEAATGGGTTPQDQA